MYFYIYWKFTIFQSSFMQKFIKYFFKNFLILIAAYHIIVTVIWYGMIWWDAQTYISFLRDALWILFIWITAIAYSEKIWEYMKKWKKVWIWFAVLLCFSVLVSYLQWTSLSNMMIWIKYGFWYLVIFLTASFVGFTWIKNFWKKELTWIQMFMMFVMLVGFLWQIMKIVLPDFFMNLWYGKLDDYSFGTNPPIYYLTWYEWTMRRQWIFAWPNNYGYFLVAFLPLVLLWRWNGFLWIKEFIQNPRKNLNFLLVVLWLAAIWMTLSRSAILWTLLIFVLLWRNWIKNHKKISIGILIAIFAGIVWLSFLKTESTLWHIKAKTAYIWEIISTPLWHGLGSSWPAIHHEWTMLPENYFMQIMLDVWTVWFILWTVCIFMLLIIFKNIEKHFENWNLDENQQAIFLQWKRLYLWWVALLVMWLFLHVFEDSMVNYIFFGLFGLISWYLSKFYDQKKSISVKELFRK